MVKSEKLLAYFGDRALNAGFTPIPNLLRRHLRALGLDEASGWFVVELIAIVWDHHAAKTLTAIAKEMGRDVATVRRHSKRLNDLGLVIIHDTWENGHRSGNSYDLTPLWQRLGELASNDDGPTTRRTIRPRGPRQDAPTIDTDARHTEQQHAEEHMFNRASVRGMNDMDARHTAHQREDIKGVKEVKEQQEAADAAAAIFSQLLSIEDARTIIAQHPEAIPHATQLVAEAKNGKKQAGLLVHLVERGWTPPAAPAADDTPICPGCGGDVRICHGIHGFLVEEAINDA